MYISFLAFWEFSQSFLIKNMFSSALWVSVWLSVSQCVSLFECLSLNVCLSVSVSEYICMVLKWSALVKYMNCIIVKEQVMLFDTTDNYTKDLFGIGRQQGNARAYIHWQKWCGERQYWNLGSSSIQTHTHEDRQWLSYKVIHTHTYTHTQHIPHPLALPTRQWLSQTQRYTQIGKQLLTLADIFRH